MEKTHSSQNTVVSGHYLRHAWDLLTAERGWFKPMLVLAVARFVPVLGQLGTEGYALEWGRLTAWQVDAHPKQKKVQVGKVLASGWRGFVVALGWNAALALLYWAVWLLLGGHTSHANRGAESVLGVVFFVLALLVNVVACVGELRATIYQRFSTGYRADRIAQMCKVDFGGLMHMVGIRVFGWLVKCLVALVFVPIALGTVLPPAIDFVMGELDGSSSALASPLALHGLLSDLAGLIPVTILMLFVLALVDVVFKMLYVTGTALWMRKFDVPNWGKSGDPLPAMLPGESEGVVPPEGMSAPAQGSHRP